MAGKPKGGARPGAGRKRGGKNKETIAKERAADRLMARRVRSAERLLELVWLEAEADVRLLYNRHGKLIPVPQLSDRAAAMIAGMETVIKNAKAGDGITDEVLKLKLRDATKAKELLMRHYRLLADTKVDEDAGDWDKRVARLHAGRDRVRKGRGGE